MSKETQARLDDLYNAIAHLLDSDADPKLIASEILLACDAQIITTHQDPRLVERVTEFRSALSRWLAHPLTPA